MTLRELRNHPMVRLAGLLLASAGGVLLLLFEPYLNLVVIVGGIYSLSTLAFGLLTTGGRSAHANVEMCAKEADVLEREPRLRMQQHFVAIRSQLRLAVITGVALLAVAVVAASVLRGADLSATGYVTTVYLAGAAIWLWVPSWLSMLQVSLSSADFVIGVRDLARTEHLRAEQLRALAAARTEIEALEHDSRYRQYITHSPRSLAGI